MRNLKQEVTQLGEEKIALREEKIALQMQVLALKDELIAEKTEHIQALRQRNALWFALVELANALEPFSPFPDAVREALLKARRIDTTIREGAELP